MGINDHRSYNKSWEVEHSSRPPKSESDWFKRAAYEASILIGDAAVTVLDVGCGDAAITCLLADRYEKVYGLDFSQSMLETAKKNIENSGKNNIELLFSDLNKLDEIFTKKVDVVICIGVIQYLSLKDFNDFIEKCCKIINEHGKIIVIGIPNLQCKPLYLVNFYKNKQYLSLATLFVKYLKLKLHILYLTITKKNYSFDDSIGEWYMIDDIIKVGLDHNLSPEIYNSYFVTYSYRFNVVYCKNKINA